jgi:Domain of unknown function (DUF4253)
VPYALLILGVYWIYVSRAQRNPWPETLVALLVQVALVAFLGWVFPPWVWKTVLLLYLTMPYWLGAVVVWRTQRFGAQSPLVPYDAERDADAVIPGARAWIDGHAVALERGGLVRVATFHAHDAATGAGSLSALLESADGHESVLLNAPWTGMDEKAGAWPTSRPVTTVSTHFADGERLTVTNYPSNPLAPAAGQRVVLFPSLRDPARMLEAARAYRARFASGPTVRVRGGTDPLEHIGERYRLANEAEVRVGRYRRLADGGWALTVWGALRGTLGLVFPLRQIEAARIRLGERRMLRALGMGPAPAAPPGFWMERTHAGAIAAAAIAVVLFLPLPHASLPAGGSPVAAFSGVRVPGSYRLPAGFAVPADFPGAVRALETLAGTSAVPMVVEDGETMEMRRTEGFEVPFDAKRTDALIAAAAPLFRARGFLLFRNGTTFGTGGEPERVALYPRDDLAEVMRLIGTSGPNFDTGVDSVVAWFARLNARHPFTVVGIGTDHLEGRFVRTPEPGEMQVLAREFYAFCPDVVDQGTGTVAALAAEMATEKTVYCWWD